MTEKTVPPIQIGMIIMWSGADPHMFDSTGLGLPGTAVEGWAICNGQNDTVALSTYFPMATDLSADTPAPLEVVGNADNLVTLSVDQLPAHNHDVVDPGHTHINDGDSFPLRDTSLSSSGSGTDVYARNGGNSDHTVAKCNTTGITTADAGGGDPISIMPRSLPLIYLQCVGISAP